ncbi:helix-turn-helix transcriptional regulator [Sporolactobacillus sp. STCC-11]|uniref:helix-turn-helix domain-containing protein n=1 Tax=Sporolactobacillus caesalpiniae TaxID=3230362 RepID=UPI003395BADB
MADLVKLTHQLTTQIPGGKELTFSLQSLMGELIFGYRMRRGFSQDELASKAGVDKKTIYRVESGHSSISTETYNKLLKALDVTLEVADVAREHLKKEKHSYFDKKKPVKI